MADEKMMLVRLDCESARRLIAVCGEDALHCMFRRLLALMENDGTQ
jgi:hypothetical protein